MTAQNVRPDSPTWARHRLTGIYVAAVLVLLTLLAQATLLTRLRFFGASPNLVLIMLLSWSLLRGPAEAVPWAFLAGILFDLIAGLPIGTSSLAWMLVCALVAFGEYGFYQGHIFLPMTAVAVATPIYAWLVLLTLQLRGQAVDWGGMTLRVVLPETLLNVVFIAAFYPALRWLLHRVRGDRFGW